jgi:hypothetical protein
MAASSVTSLRWELHCLLGGTGLSLTEEIVSSLIYVE